MAEEFDQCPVCGGELKSKTVEKLLRGGNNTAVIEVRADVCLRCGERLYDESTVNKFEDIRSRLRENKVEGMEPVGNAYRV